MRRKQVAQVARRGRGETSEVSDEPVIADFNENDESQHANLTKFLSQPAELKRFEVWIVGDTPLIVHAWSEKARTQMLQKQSKALGPGKAARQPVEEFEASLYSLPTGGFGFPATAVKKCLLTAAHKDKGIARDLVMRSLWIDAPYVQVRTAFPDAMCDLPLMRLYGSEPVMREDMVRIGSGLNKTANLTWRGQFMPWAMLVTGRFNASVLTAEVIPRLITESGQACGIGDWRNEKSGSFGTFHLASDAEAKAWDAHRQNPTKIPAPVPAHFKRAAE